MRASLSASGGEPVSKVYGSPDRPGFELLGRGFESNISLILKYET